MAYKNQDHEDMTLFKNRLWKLMERDGLHTAKDLAGKLATQGIISYAPRKHDEVWLEEDLIKQKAKSIEKKVQVHLTSDSCKCLDGEYIIAYTTLFSCSADYLLLGDECTTKNAQHIHDETGLSENVISILTEKNQDIIILLDALFSYDNITDSSNLYSIFENMLENYFRNYLSSTKNYQSDFMKDAEEQILYEAGDAYIHTKSDTENQMVSSNYLFDKTAVDIIHRIIFNKPVFNHFCRKAELAQIENLIAFNNLLSEVDPHGKFKEFKKMLNSAKNDLQTSNEEQYWKTYESETDGFIFQKSKDGHP